MLETTPSPGLLRESDRLVLIVGNYGSGKTEIAVNLALAAARAGRRVRIADLDLVNPYFRCREAHVLMERSGIRVVMPPEAWAWADLPIVVPEILGLTRPEPGTLTIFDVGGDDVGARVLASLRCVLAPASYGLWQVVNAQRPFTGNVAGCLAMRAAIERASRLRVTGLLSNAHLMEETTPATVVAGWELARSVAAEGGIPLRGVAVMEPLDRAPEMRAVDAPLLAMRRRMRPPWLRATERTHGTHRH